MQLPEHTIQVKEKKKSLNMRHKKIKSCNCLQFRICKRNIQKLVLLYEEVTREGASISEYVHSIFSLGNQWHR